MSDKIFRDPLYKHNQPYFPEKEADYPSAKNAIRIIKDGQPIEISRVLDRLKPLTTEPVGRVRYYIPKDLHTQAQQLRSNWKSGQ